MIFFTSDTHYWHSNIIEFSKRPYGSLGQMHAEFIKNWNSVVQDRDEVFHLGDVSFANLKMTMPIIYQLNGRIRYIKGNHDSKSFVRPQTDDLEFGSYYERTFDKQKVVMCHFPLLTWNKAAHGSWMLHGHCHGSLDKRNQATKRLDVGVDAECSAYKPISLDEVTDIMKLRTYEVVDSHGANR